jgi:uncharacterized protein (TIGR03435 family)
MCVAAGTIFGCFASCMAFGQSASFDVASVKPSRVVVGRDGTFSTDPGRLIARNATLKRLIFEAWRIPWAQIAGGPEWLDSDEFDIDAKAENPASAEQLRLMLRALLADRFRLAVRSEMRERRVYALVVGKDGPKLGGARAGEGSHLWRFHGDLSKFADVLAIQLTIPLLDDPSTPSHASGSAVPVVDKTGITGVYDINLDIKPDQGSDTFTVWQRALEEQLGLKLESQRGTVEFLVVEHAERIPTGN